MSRKILTFVVIVAAGIAGKFGVDYMMTAARPDPTPAQMEQVILKSAAATTYSAVREYFPEEADMWLERMVALEIKRRDGTLAPGEAIDSGAIIRQKYAPYLAKAPDASLIDVMSFQITLFELYEANTDACNRLIMQGPGGLTMAERKKIESVLEQSGVQIKAMYDGLTRPQTYAPANDQDWEDFYASFLAAGYSAADYDLVLTPDQADPGLCNAYLGFFRTLRDTDFDGASRVRAQVVPSIVGS